MSVVGIDIGGTFTDVVYIGDGQIHRGKADTTHYDLKIGVMNATRAAAARANVGLEDALRQAEAIVYSTTVGTNKDFNFSFDPEWIRIVEFYCPSCAVMVENEYLPPGHPLTWDIDLDLDALKRKYQDAG